MTLSGHGWWNSGVRTAVFSSNGMLALTASCDGTAKLWSTRARVFGKRRGFCLIVKMAVFSFDDSLVLTRARDARLWRTSCGTCLHVFRAQDDAYCGTVGMHSAVFFSADCGAVITAMDNHCGHVWDCDSGRCILTIRLQQSVRLHHACYSAVQGGGCSRLHSCSAVAQVGWPWCCDGVALFSLNLH